MDTSQTIVMENDHVRLEPLGPEHMEHLLPICLNHPTLLQYSPTPFGTEAAMHAIIASAQKDRKTGIRYAFAIYSKQANAYVGNTSFGSITPAHHRMEIGWTWIAPFAQGTGLNHHCKSLLLHYAFETVGCQRIEFRTDERNAQSRKAIEKLGASYEGRLREHFLMPDGAWRNTIYYSILKSEWPAIKAERFS